MKQKIFLLSALVIAFAACNDNEPQVINYYIDDNPAVVQGQLSGKFSVSATKKVSFSQGNLQYNAAQNVWRFADNQYDFVGDASNGTVKIGTAKCNNALVSYDYNGWIDLFGWGTGSNPTNNSSKTSDYPTFVDWGKNRIYNGGDKVNLWRSLTNEEWLYLFGGRKNAKKKFAFGHIYLNTNKTDSINGLFLLPDSWKQPDDVEFNLSIDKGLEWGTNYTYDYYFNYKGDNYNHNEYTLDEWKKLEDSGVVFFPISGYRTDGNVGHINSGVLYWSSTPYDNMHAYLAYYTYNHLQTQFTYDRCLGCAVRLVR